MRKFVYSTIACLLLCLSVSAQTVSAPISDYVRYLKAPTPSLETAVVRMLGPSGQSLDLISAVHVGDAAYYQDLNTRFRAYDAVLYELILPESVAGQPLPAKMEGGGALSGLQGMLSRTLGMVTQLDHIDYSARNFVHADLTHEGLKKSMGARQESLMTYFQKALSSNSQGGKIDLGVSDKELAELNLMGILSGTTSAKDRTVLKKMMATALTNPQGALDVFGDSALLVDRNTAALSVVDTESAKGRRKLALFYGAAHMPDLEARLLKKGWKRGGSHWLKAWSNI